MRIFNLFRNRGVPLTTVLVDNLLAIKKREAVMLITEGHIRVNNKVVRRNIKIKPGKEYVIQKGKRQRVTIKL